MKRVEVDRAVPGPHTLFTYDPCLWCACAAVSVCFDPGGFKFEPAEPQPPIPVICSGCGNPRVGHVYVEIEEEAPSEE